MKTSIANQIDQLYWNNSVIDWNEIDDVFNNPFDVIISVDYFLTNLRPNHELPGDVYYKLLGIANWAREENFLTKKQLRYAAIGIAGYWNELDDLAKANIMLY
jgi:hypothetical protein